MTLRSLVLLALAACAATPAARAQPTPVPGGDGVSANQVAFHDGRVTFLRLGDDYGRATLVHLDPATGRATETPLTAPDGFDSFGMLRPIAGRLYIETSNPETGATGPLLALDGPAFRPTPANATLSGLDRYTVHEVGGRTFAALPTAADPSAHVLAEIGPDGRVTALEPPPPPDGRGVSYATPLGDAVYVAVQTGGGSSLAFTLWRVAGGTSAPADVLPEGAGDVVGIAAAGGALYVSAQDRTTSLVHLFRLAPGAARAVRVPGFETPPSFESPFGYVRGLFRAVGDALVFSAPAPGGDAGEGGPRLALYRQRGTAAPERVAGVDLGSSEAFDAAAVREVDGALYVAGYAPDDADLYDVPRNLFHVGADGPATLVARIEGGYPMMSGSDVGFVVAGGQLYVVVQPNQYSGALVSVPLDAVPRP